MTQTAASDSQLARWQRFRENRNAALAEEHGWLTLTSFQWLEPTPSPVELVPGLWSTSEETGVEAAVLTARAEEGLVFDEEGTPVDGTFSAHLSEDESLNWVRYGTIVVELAMRGGRYAIRTRDSASPTRTEFHGVPTFPYAPEWVVEARWEPYPEPRAVPISTANPLVDGVHLSAGEVVFSRHGHEYRLQAEQGRLGGLTITFHDETNGKTTDDWRKVETPRPRPDGTVVLDFNRAINYPSAFTPYGTCPMPVRGNSLDLAVEAGERTPEAE
ncbi:hypothetical protein GCM10012320_05860 [Sinomonas cellulolyticus]|uniref:DUF1684 domain-containing protein n=1 Tax=Sinomonas cellulolyticus TaxID=2801916 RepID=A0ABS1K377_9MICC|nr:MULTISPECIES: DUF1684 domain-containing protein [Sinomonas]MBL0705913.1 DUF1684 domain-containing protein [Sinomonas cellulolyticus]GHG42624.1 hypothetical protein GCM10012320_05860 [Sinomonas sp. KCTC 49339]